MSKSVFHVRDHDRTGLLKHVSSCNDTDLWSVVTDYVITCLMCIVSMISYHWYLSNDTKNISTDFVVLYFQVLFPHLIL